MLRKLLSSILCLLLALSLPLCAFAATQSTLTVVPGDELAKEQIVKELMELVAIRVTDDVEAKAGSLSILLGGDSVISLAARLTDEGIFAQSALLGDKALYIDKDDIIKLLGDAVNQSGNPMLEQLISGIGADEAQPKTQEEAIALLEKKLAGDPVLLEAVTDIVNRAVITEGEFTSELHDPATCKIEITVTSADYVKLADSNYMRSMLENVLKSQSPDVADDELAAEIDTMIADMKKAFADMNLNIPIVLFTADEGNTLVAMTSDTIAEGTVDETSENGAESTPVKLSNPTSYYRLTSDGAVNHTIAMDMIVNDKTEAVVKGSLTELDDGTANGVFGMLAASQEINLTYEKTVAGDTKNSEIALYMRGDATTLLEPAASDRPIISFKLESKEVSGEELAAVKEATKDSALNLLKMNAEEAQSLMSGITTRATQLLYTVLGKMPPSVLELFGAMMPAQN